MDPLNLHPDDILKFNEVVIAMKEVAKDYNLPLRSVTGLKMPLRGMADRMGECTHDGHIRIVFRCTINGEWCDRPLDPDSIWQTAAHELAHLIHFNHSVEFFNLCEELHTALMNKRPSDRSKLLDKLVKMQRSRDNAVLRMQKGDSQAEEAQKEAEAFAQAINRLCLEHELNPNDVDYAAATLNDPIMEKRINYEQYGIKVTKIRSAWMERLARYIANAHFCQFLVSSHSNQIWLVGTRSHVIVAEYLFGMMVPFIDKQSKQAELEYWYATGRGRGKENKAAGYRAAWIEGFVTRLWERFEEVRKESLAKAQAEFNLSTEKGLMRLNGSLLKVQNYINDKFKHVKTASSLRERFSDHADGRSAGRSAADKINLGKRGVNAPTERKQLN